MKYWMTVWLWIVLSFFLINIFTLSVPWAIFHTPDELANFIVVQEYWTSWKMFLQAPYLDIDHGNNLHPRWFLTHNERLVPFNFLWLPLIYWPFYAFFAEYVHFLNSVFFFLIMVFAYSLARLWFDIKKEMIWIVFLVVLSSLPLLFYYNFPYYNIVPFLTFFVLFLYYIQRFHYTNKILYLYLGVLFALFAIRMRYEQVLFIWLFMMIVFIQHRRLYFKRKNLLRDILWVIFMGIVVFVVPLLTLNKSLYGTPLTYWYSLFTQTFFAEERTWTRQQAIINTLYQGHQFDLGVLWINLKNNLFLIAPIFFLLAYSVLWKRAILKRNWPYLLLSCYIIFYTWMSPTYGSGIDTVTLHGSIPRYFFVLYFIALFLVLKPLLSIKKWLALAVCFVLFNKSLFFTDVSRILTSFDGYNDAIALMQPHLSQDAYLITTVEDKFTYILAHQITRWCWIDCDEHFEKNKYMLIETIRHLLQQWEEVFALESRRFSSDYHFGEFRKWGITISHIEWNLYQLSL